MARRRLEAAIQAGKAIGEGKGFLDKFTKVSIDHEITLEKEVDGVYALQFSFDGKFLAVGCGNGMIRLYDTASGRRVSDLRKTRYGGFPIMSLRFHPKNPAIIYAGTSEGQVLSCDISDFITDDSGQQKGQQKELGQDERWSEILQEKKGVEKNEINCLDFDFTYSRYATAGKDLNVRIYDANTNQLIHEYTGYSVDKDPTDPQTMGNNMRVFALKWHPMYDDIFTTGGWENQIKIWDSRSNDGVKRSIHGPKICGDSLDLKDYSILTGSYRGNHELEIWNYSDERAKPKAVDFHSPDGAFIYAAQFCDNNVIVAGGSGTNSAKAINTDTGEVLGEVSFQKPVQAIDSTYGGRIFAVGDGGTALKICSLK